MSCRYHRDATETYLFFRDGYLLHSHQNRAAFERLLESYPDRYPAERCEIVRFVPETEVATAEAGGRQAQRKADAARVRAAGCICAEIEADLDADEHLPDPPLHDARCPIALADAIEEGR